VRKILPYLYDNLSSFLLGGFICIITRYLLITCNCHFILQILKQTDCLYQFISVGPSPTTPPTPGRELQIYISEPTSVSIPAGGSASFRCGTRVSTQGPLRITWSRENGVIPPGRARDDGRGKLDDEMTSQRGNNT